MIEQCVAIAGLTALGCVAMWRGINGKLLVTISALIGLIAGVSLDVAGIV
jgi:hypothetical protein